MDWIETGVREGAELIVDGRDPEVPSATALAAVSFFYRN
jgi:hypothetical protein